MPFPLLLQWSVRIGSFDFDFLISIPLDRPNWQDWGGRWTRRTAFMRHLKTVLEELDIRYTMPVQPVLLPTSHSVLYK